MILNMDDSTDPVGIIFHVTCFEVTSNHNGYCSGAENEDEEIYIKFSFKVSVSRNIYAIMKSLQQTYSLTDTLNRECQFYCETTKQLNGGSNYCKPSPSGKKHKVTTTFHKIVSVDLCPTKFNCEDPSIWKIKYPETSVIQKYAH